MRAAEVVVDVAYTQPTGAIARDHHLEDEIGPGIGVGLGIGYRATPHWSFDLGAQFHASASAGVASWGRGPQGAAALGGFTWHALPFELVDPYVSFASGYRWLWEQRAGERPSTSGLEPLRAQVGMDLRTSRDVGLSLYVAADLDYFQFADAGSSFGGGSLESPGLTAFFSVGVQGRFDFGGGRVARPRVVADR